jgi:hypothetical protein
MSKEVVYFTMYDDREMRSQTIAEARERQLTNKGRRLIRLVIEQDGAVGVPKIISSEFVRATHTDKDYET